MPDGCLAHLCGLIAVFQHDPYMLACSKLLSQLHALMLQGQDMIYSLFGDLAYPMSAYLYRGVTWQQEALKQNGTQKWHQLGSQ
jgi:hypothetical protein